MPPHSASSGLWSISPMRMAAGLIVLLAGLLVIGFLAVDVSRQIDAQSSAASDNLQWALSQVDVELMALEIDLDDTTHEVAHLPLLRTRFDIFYARVKILQVGSAFARLRENPEFIASFNRLEAFVTETAKIMDGPDSGLIAAVPALKEKVRALMPDGHKIGLVGVGVFANQSDERRNAVKDTLEQLALATVALVVALLATLGRVLQLDRGNRRRAEETAQSLARLDAVVTTSLDAVITLDDAGRIVDFNPAACQTFGYAREDVVGRDLGLLVPHLSPQGEVQLPPQAADHPAGRRRFRVSARHQGGGSFPAEVSLSTTQAGARVMQVVFLRDLSQQVEAEQALVAARDKALAGAKTKADLLLVMSHEIRTPLNGMIGTIDLLEGTDLAPQQREYLRIMAASGRLLMHHINDVLEVARLDSGRATLTLAPVDLGALVTEVIANQRPAAIAGGNRLRFQPEAGGRHLVQGDGTMIRHVLMNLVGNAVKFTRDGEVVVSVRHLTAQGPTEITVSDTGIGIRPEDIGRIFEDFVTLDATYARNASGTGLGLGIVRRIVTRMGGTISVDSTPGRGSAFRVSLPLTILDGTSAAPAARGSQDETPPLEVLVVEDNEFNRLIVRDMLMLEGHRVTEAQNGLEGVRLADAHGFDAILMDISMPGIDGLQAAERIRKGKGASKDAPIIALTAHATREEADRFRAGGMNEVLVKPITRDALRAVLAGQRPQVDRAEPPEGLISAEVMTQLQASLGSARADRLVDQFLADTETRMASLGTRFQSKEAETELLAEIHRMIGSAAMFGAAALHGRLSSVEDLCKRGDKAQARQAVPGLMNLWQATAAAYRNRSYRAGATPDGQRADGSFAQASSLR